MQRSNSAAILKKGEHHEVKTNIHSQPNCQSHQKIKNILLEGSKGVFQGKVFVVSDKAQKTNAYQIEQGSFAWTIMRI